MLRDPLKFSLEGDRDCDRQREGARSHLERKWYLSEDFLLASNHLLELYHFYVNITHYGGILGFYGLF